MVEGLYNKIEIETKIDIDGSFTSTRNMELEVIDSELDSIESHYLVFGDNTFIKPVIKVSGNAGDSKITGEIIQKGDKSIIYVVEFSPALKKGEKVTYEITHKGKSGGFAMHRDFISEMINKRKWRYKEPYEEDGFRIAYPIKKLIKKTILPVNYNVRGREYLDVLIGDGSDRAIGEYNRIKKKEKECFSKDKPDNKIILKLEVDRPEMGLTYSLKWIPPTKKEYKKLLKKSKRDKPITLERR